MRPLVKICGVTRVEDAVLAVELGADLLGLNFFAGSPRGASVEQARAIARELAGRVPLVGVFVDATVAEVERAVAELDLELVQLHGEVAPEVAARFAPRRLAVLCGRLPAASDYASLPEAWGFLVDSATPGLHGGSGRAWEWAPLPPDPAGRPVLVAGGIRPENVLRALAVTAAAGVDVASGVESAPGIKDPNKLRALFEEISHVVPTPGLA